MSSFQDIQITRNEDDNIVGNPIGVLQELCISKGWTLPIYELEREIGPPHEREFTITCTVLSQKEYGRGKSKKLAKRIAAHKMCKIIDEMDQKGVEISKGYKNKPSPIEIISHNLISLASFGIRNRRKVMLCSVFLMFFLSTIPRLFGYSTIYKNLTNSSSLNSELL